MCILKTNDWFKQKETVNYACMLVNLQTKFFKKYKHMHIIQTCLKQSLKGVSYI